MNEQAIIEWGPLMYTSHIQEEYFSFFFWGGGEWGGGGGSLCILFLPLPDKWYRVIQKSKTASRCSIHEEL